MAIQCIHPFFIVFTHFQTETIALPAALVESDSRRAVTAPRWHRGEPGPFVFPSWINFQPEEHYPAEDTAVKVGTDHLAAGARGQMLLARWGDFAPLPMDQTSRAGLQTMLFLSQARFQYGLKTCLSPDQGH
jgi:hypothetical protein